MHSNSYARVAGLVLTSVALVAFVCAQRDPTSPSVHWVSITISPSVSDKCIDQHPPVLVVYEDHSMIMNGDKLTFEQIRPAFMAILPLRSDKRVFLKASGRLRYREVTRVVGELQSVPELQVVLLTPKLESAPCAPPIPKWW
jgi:biopolymer transport protein ExbD